MTRQKEMIRQNSSKEQFNCGKAAAKAQQLTIDYYLSYHVSMIPTVNLLPLPS